MNLNQLRNKLSQHSNKFSEITIHSANQPGLVSKQKFPIYLYRGQSDDYGSITPTFFRDKILSRFDKFLINSYSRFRMIDLLPIIMDDVCETICKHPYVRTKIKGQIHDYGFIALPIAQHYGFPTTLLDVTTDLDVALSFSAKLDSKGKGYLYRFETKKLVNTTILNQIPKELSFERPKRQHAAVIDLQFLQNKDTKQFDYELKNLGDLIEKFEFTHSEADKEYKNKCRELLRVTKPEVSFVEDILNMLNIEYDASNQFTTSIIGNLARVISECPYKIMHNNINLLSQKEIDKLVQFAKEVMAMTLFDSIVHFVTSWPRLSFDKPLEEILQNTQKKIVNLYHREKSSLSPNISQIINVWKNYVVIDNFRVFVERVNTQMQDWSVLFSPDFRKIHIPNEINDEMAVMVREHIQNDK